MAKKKKPKKLSTPKKQNASTSPKARKKGKKSAGSIAAKVFQPRVLSTFAFGTSGLLAGLATGLNHFPTLGQTDSLPKMMLLAAYLGDPHLDVGAGVATGFAGLVMGACLGFSALSEPKDMLLSLILSVGFAIAAVTFTGNVALAGLGFLAGHTPAIMAYLRLKNG